MDPKTALLDMLEFLDEGDTEAALGAFMDLQEWIAKGGFVPKEIRTAINVIRNL